MKDRSIIKLRIPEILSNKGMTRRQLAEKMGKSPQYIGALINNPQSLSVNALVLIAEALGVEFGDLFYSSFNSKNTDGSSLREADDMQVRYLKQTLEHSLRFPASTDIRVVSELMASICICLGESEWRSYYTETLLPMLAPGFVMDIDYLSTFLTKSEVERVQRLCR